MHRPLWQILLTLFALGFVLQRATIVVVVGAQDAEAEPLGIWVASYVAQVVAGLAFALGLWRGSRWVIGALLLLGICVAASALLEGFFLDRISGPVALSQMLVAAVATGGLALILHHELGEEGTARRGDASRRSR